jgi:hypothetical protein
MKFRNTTFFLTFLIAARSLAMEEIIHVVKEGETLSSIARKEFKGKLYGPDGVLAKVIKLNPSIANKDLIFVGNEIVIKVPEKIEVQTSPKEEEVLVSPVLPVVKVEEEKSPHFINRFKVFSRLALTTLTSTDNQTGAVADLSSKKDIQLGGEWEQVWSQNFQSYAQVSYRKIYFEKLESSTKTLLDSDSSIGEFRIGLTQSFSPEFSLKYSFGYGEKLFLRGKTSTSVAIESDYVPSLILGSDYMFYVKEQASLGARAELAYLMKQSADDVQIDSGLEGMGEFYGTYDSWNLGVGYKYRKEKNSIVNTTEKSAFGQLDYTLHF